MYCSDIKYCGLFYMKLGGSAHHYMYCSNINSCRLMLLIVSVVQFRKVLQCCERLWIVCYEIWRFYTSVNTLQWYKFSWIFCYDVSRFYTSVNILQWYNLLWIDCYEIWRFYTSVNTLQLYSLLWIVCSDVKYFGLVDMKWSLSTHYKYIAVKLTVLNWLLC